MKFADRRLYILLGYTESTVCIGSSESVSGSDRDHYRQLLDRFENCTYVQGNIDVHPMDDLVDENLSFDFFNKITEVTGYVRVRGRWPKSVKKLPFESLAIIRGENLIALGDNQPKQYSLFIYNMVDMDSLSLKSLRGEYVPTYPNPLLPPSEVCCGHLLLVYCMTHLTSATKLSSVMNYVMFGLS